MGSGKRHQHKSNNNNHFRARTTRSSKGRLLTDPGQTTQELTSQLRSMGLYAAPTLGDGNCLFRALSDQYYGSPSRHVEVRRDVCDWIAKHKERYEGFVDEDEFGSGGGKHKVDAYLKRMRENATYGGHMELSAFAHLTGRNIKVIQPGLVYIIECDPKNVSSQMDVDEDGSDDDDDLNARDRRRLRRDRMKAAKEKERTEEEGLEAESEAPTIYVAYHDWEHFSSIRNLKGPHTGLPNIREGGSPPEPKPKSFSSSLSPSSKKMPPKIKLKLSKPKEQSATPEASSSSSSSSKLPNEIPLPPSRSLSPLPPASAIRLSPPRVHRSPKRSFDESSEASGTSESSKRSRTSGCSSLSPSKRRKEEEGGGSASISDSELSEPEETPSLSPGSPASLSSSSLSSLSPSPEPEPEPEVVEKPLTRRQRKRLGLPKQRTVGGAGKIVIPGGRYRPTAVAAANVKLEEEDPPVEWVSNGAGRVDVRGFRELKI